MSKRVPERPTKPLNICGPRIARLRTRAGWTQTQLAGKCQLAGWDISRDIIARIELRNRVVTDSDLLMLARVFKVEAGELLPAAS